MNQKPRSEEFYWQAVLSQGKYSAEFAKRNQPTEVQNSQSAETSVRSKPVTPNSRVDNASRTTSQVKHSAASAGDTGSGNIYTSRASSSLPLSTLGNSAGSASIHSYPGMPGVSTGQGRANNMPARRDRLHDGNSDRRTLHTSTDERNADRVDGRGNSFGSLVSSDSQQRSRTTQGNSPSQIFRQDDDSPDSRNNAVLTSFDYSVWDQDWQTARELDERDVILELEVTGFNRGGLLVRWRSLSGFVPASQLISTEFENESTDEVLESFVGEILQLRIIELDPQQNRFILSERAAQAERGSRDQLFSTLKTGDVVEGRVTNICDFGVFVDLGGIEGLVHISELSWGRVTDPEKFVERNKPIEVYVMRVDEQQKRIALSIKRLLPDPWKTVAERYRPGQVVSGMVTGIVDYGIFVALQKGLEGLIHQSELSEPLKWRYRDEPLINEGDIITARILNIDPINRRMGLSLREYEGSEGNSAQNQDEA